MAGLLGCLTLVSGCGRSPARAYHAERAKVAAEEPKAAAKSNEPQTADAWLDRLAAAYAGAKSYADQGEILLTYPRNGQEVSDRTSFAVQFERPGKLAAAIYQATLAIDGETLQARLDDLEGQTLTLPVPDPLTLEWLYQDPVLARLLTEGLARSSPQLDLLLGGGSLAETRKSATSATLVDDQTIDGRPCVGVKLTHGDGELVFWIDRESTELRRIDYPAGNLPPGGRLVASFSGARLNPALDRQVFKLAPLGESKPVVRFVPPPLPLPALLGQEPRSFTVTDLDGKEVTKESLAGKPAVIEFWFKDCPPCPERMPRLQKVYETFKDNDRVRFLTISVDSPEVPNEQLAAKLGEWKVNVPTSRDAQGAAAQAFDCQSFPQMFVLGADGRVQALDTVLGGELLPELPTLLERLLAKEDLASDLRKKFDTHQQAFEQALADAAPSATNAAQPVVAEIAAASEPKRIKLEPLWDNTELRFPGNIVPLTEADGSTRLFVMEGAAGVAELDAEGKIVGRHELHLPEGTLVTYLRTATDGQGRRYFVGSASGQPQAHVFDENWQAVLSYPQIIGGSSGLGDARLADLDADGALELVVGHWGEKGVQGVSLSGEQKWLNPSLRNVPGLAFAQAAGAPRVWALNDRGTIVPLDGQGKADQEIETPGRFFIAMAASESPAGAAGLSIDQRGNLTVVGLDAGGRETWNYPLPSGTHRKPIEPIAAGPIAADGTNAWLLAGPDGSVHLVSAAGEPIDQFAVGGELTGLAAAKLNGQPTVLIGTPQGVRAWRVSVGEHGLAGP
jgi:thiol-disulfide isomerase/thioredoxin